MRLIQICTLKGHLDRVNHSVQTIYPLCAHIRCPCLEQHIILQLSPSANFAIQMSPPFWQLPQAHPIPRLLTALNVAPIRDFIYHLTDNFFGSCPAHPNPHVRSIGNYTLADLHRQYKKYIQKRTKHLLL